MYESEAHWFSCRSLQIEITKAMFVNIDVSAKHDLISFF